MKRLLLLIAVVLTLTACGKAKADKKVPEAVEKKVYKSVRLQEVERSDIARNDISSGIIDPINEVAQITETGGEVAEINYKNGDRVEKGKVVVRL